MEIVFKRLCKTKPKFTVKKKHLIPSVQYSFWLPSVLCPGSKDESTTGLHLRSVLPSRPRWTWSTPLFQRDWTPASTVAQLSKQRSQSRFRHLFNLIPRKIVNLDFFQPLEPHPFCGEGFC